MQLSDDGFRVVGTPKHVYDGWKYPEHWDVEGYSQEGPKITRHNGWYYMTTAVGGTAGPPTGHTAPNNPITRTRSADEPWWSRGHATLVEGTDKRWWMLYHGYEHGFWTLGRQALLDPSEWMPDGWFVARGGDLGTPLKKPSGQALPHGLRLSDDFRASTLGPQWAFFDPAADEARRLTVGNGVLRLQGKGSAPRDASPLTVIAPDQAYWFEVHMTVAQAGRAARCCSTATSSMPAWAAMARTSSCTAMAKNARPNWHPAARAARCGCASPTTATSSPFTAAPTAPSGPSIRCRWKCPATTTT
ncbi:xylosidase precursor [Xanthomonas fragariae]|uniref:Glycosyl hydrolases family 43 n=1 Tax=Xanthomonas fragariae TaxID=48664 RepID=A0A1Y6HNL8_9XANT|nr:Glycosyl hydrolases family 43 [Xanthomonas fragariae]SMR05129.1 xylosidase precursor [Xanthomonas fragariae]